ncbi:MAG TPA: aspartate carbamoyltransferase [Candidatus Saccharimonadales bacterium]|nr:aspartate carbamoyltransferase [Candidatus Saccharimonadales bacterium]
MGISNVLSVDQFDIATLEKIFSRAEKIENLLKDESSTAKLAKKHLAKQVCTLFYEPSTRTRLSFETAALKLGMGVVSTENAAGFSSAAKGETLEDTINVLNNYHLSAIIIRHTDTGAAEKAASVSKVPIINAGDGAGEHPTQALLDAYSIRKHFGRLDNLRITAGGDLKYGRTIRSLCRLLALYPGNHINFISIPELQIGDDIKKLLKKSGTTFDEIDDLNKVFPETDVVYWTRLQKERIKNADSIDYDKFTLTKDNVSKLPEKAIILHPLPRIHEITTDVDNDPRAKYFEQAGNGLLIRMALLDMIASK